MECADVPGDGTIFHRARVDDRSTRVMSVPKPTVMDDGDRPLSSDSEPPADTKTSGPDFGGPFPCAMDVPIPVDTEVSDRSPTETPDLAGDLGRKTESPLSGFGRSSTGEIQFPGDGTVFNRARVDDQLVGAVPVPKPTVAEDRDRPLSSDSEPPGDTETSGKPDFGDPIPCVMDVPIPNDTEVSDPSPSETPDLAGDLGRKTDSPLSGFSKLVIFNVCMLVRVYDGMRGVRSCRGWKRWLSQYIIRCSVNLTVTSGTS